MPHISREPFWDHWTRTLPTPPREWLKARWFWAIIACCAVVIVGGTTWVWALSGFSSMLPGSPSGLAALSRPSHAAAAPIVTRRVAGKTPAPIFLPGTIIPGPSSVITAPGRIISTTAPGFVVTAPGKIISTTAPGSVTTAPGTQVTVTVPGPTVTVPGPTVTVPGPTVTVNGPEQPGPTVTVTAPPQPGPTVTVTSSG